jgi:hypothetical protein
VIARRALAVGVAVAVAVAAAVGASAAPRPTPASLPADLRTAVVDPVTFGEGETRAAFVNVRRTGATLARLAIDWSVVAPEGAERPEGFAADRPDEPLYRWAGVDRQVRDAVAAGLSPILSISGAPLWAQRRPEHRRPQDGPYRPSYRALAEFALAAARRYSGTFADLPRVRYWQVWNEPNFSFYLTPQTVAGRIVSAGWYRAMVNAMADAVHGVRRDNVVIAGGLAPYGATTETLEGISPMLFMRTLLCMSAGPKPRRTCPNRITFDVWSHHPYTSGGPRHASSRQDDVSLGDMPEMNALLRAAERAGVIRSPRRVGFWVTEFSWDTRPPDPKGLPLKLHARWVSEALYRLWRSGVSVVTWYGIRDQPVDASPNQSGLFNRGPGGIDTDTPKPSLQAFRFPFVAFRNARGRVSMWGRTPDRRRATVVVEREVPGGWRVVARLRTTRTGMFTGTLPRSGRNWSLRARIGRGERSLPFSLVDQPDRDFCPFGSC